MLRGLRGWVVYLTVLSVLFVTVGPVLAQMPCNTQEGYMQGSSEGYGCYDCPVVGQPCDCHHWYNSWQCNSPYSWPFSQCHEHWQIRLDYEPEINACFLPVPECLWMNWHCYV